MSVASPVEPTAATRRSRPGFSSGVASAVLLVLLACGYLVPRSVELASLGDAVLRVTVAVVIVGGVLCVPRRTRWRGAGLVVGAAIGLAVAWSALIVYVGLVQV